MEQYDNASGDWTKAPPMSTERAEFGAAVAGGCIYAVGGMDVESSELSTVERFNPKTGRWEDVASLSGPRCGHCVVALDDESIYALGGYDGDEVTAKVERFDVLKGTWHQVTSMKACRKDFAVAVLNGEIYAM